MTPRLATPETNADLDVTRENGRWRVFAIALFVAALAAGGAVAAIDGGLPPPGVYVLLAVLLACAVNRYALFPTELAVTAEVAVLLAAVIGWREASPVTGPWLLALLAGPCDLVHWRQRAYVRMAYNAGNRALSTLAAALACSGVVAVMGSSSMVALGTAAVCGAVAFGAAEGAIGTVLARLRDHRTWLGAMRAEIPMELLTVPLGLVGAVAGDAGASVGWWLATLVLVPTLFVPELVLVPRRSAAARFVHLAAPVATGAALLAVVALVAPWPDAPTLVGLLVLALLAGLELRVDARRPVPAMAAAVVAAALVVSGGADFAGAVMVAIAATVTAGILARTGQWWAPVLAAAAAAAAAGIVDAHASRAGVVLAVVVFEVVALAPLDRVVWTAPIVGTAVALATVWGVVGAPGALAFGAGLAVAGRAAVACGAPPWRSRILGPRAARRPAPGVRWRWYVAVAAATGCSVGAATTASARDLLVPTAAAAVSAIAAMGALAARQWRFAPRRRVRDGAVTLAAAGAAVLAYPPLALDGDWSALVVLAAALVAATTVLRPLARRAERAAAAAAPSDVSGVAAR